MNVVVGLWQRQLDKTCDTENIWKIRYYCAEENKMYNLRRSLFFHTYFVVLKMQKTGH